MKTYTYDDLLNGTASTDAHYYLQSEADEEIKRLKGDIFLLEEDVAYWKSKYKILKGNL